MRRFFSGQIGDALFQFPGGHFEGAQRLRNPEVFIMPGSLASLEMTLTGATHWGSYIWRMGEVILNKMQIILSLFQPVSI